MAEFVGGDIKVVNPEESVEITLSDPIATVKFNVYSAGRYVLDIGEDGFWTVTKEFYDEAWRKKHYESSYNQGFVDGYEMCKKKCDNLLRNTSFLNCIEKPPEEDGCYLVYAPDYSGGSSSSKENHDGVMFSNFKNGKWSIEVGYHKRPGCVKAWMPIPKYEKR